MRRRSLLTLSGRTIATLQALLVTVLWSSSWVLIKVGLREPDLPPLGFAGLRYTLAALLLLPFALRGLRASSGGGWRDRRLLASVAALGLLLYTACQGAQYVALGLLPAVATSLVLTTSPVLVALLGLQRSGERASACSTPGAEAGPARTPVCRGRPAGRRAGGVRASAPAARVLPCGAPCTLPVCPAP